MQQWYFRYFGTLGYLVNDKWNFNAYCTHTWKLFEYLVGSVYRDSRSERFETPDDTNDVIVDPTDEHSCSKRFSSRNEAVVKLFDFALSSRLCVTNDPQISYRQRLNGPPSCFYIEHQLRVTNDTPATETCSQITRDLSDRNCTLDCLISTSSNYRI